MSQIVLDGVHLLDDTLIDHTACCANAMTTIGMRDSVNRRALFKYHCVVLSCAGPG